MKKKMLVVLSLLVAASVAAQNTPQNTAPAPSAQPPKPASLNLFVYPGQGQDAAKQGTDENECYTWAKDQTGIDPTAAPTQAEAPDTPKGGAVKGAARGAARGAAVGQIADNNTIGDEGNLDAGEGAAAGAAAGAVRGRRKQKKAEKKAEATAQQTAQTQDAQKKETFKTAWGTCLTGRGYTVK